MEPTRARRKIEAGTTVLGIELGSTRIKACLIGEDATEVIATGSHTWENQMTDGLWTYSLYQVWDGLRKAFADLQAQVKSEFDTTITQIAGLGVSAMMHGYLPFDGSDELLVPFRTWRNTNTEPAARELSELLDFNIPLRWSVAHLYQAILDEETHVGEITFLTTLAGYVHWKLTDQRVLGVGDASGMFPIAGDGRSYDPTMVARVDAHLGDRLPTQSITDLLPGVLQAGDDAGRLTAAGAALLDPKGNLQPGALMCPPEGDAGTGMVATNAVAPRSGNVSAGTSIFAMVVLEKALERYHPELDVVTTPTGSSVAMVHCNNGASELAAWVGLFQRFCDAAGVGITPDAVYEVLFTEALQAAPDAGGVLAYNQLSGEPIVGLTQGSPAVVRSPESEFTLANFMRSNLYGVFAALTLGMDILTDEGVRVERMYAHGGVFQTGSVAQRFLAAALDAPVSLGETASYGGAWGIAVLAAYRCDGGRRSLADHLNEVVFAGTLSDAVEPLPADVEGYRRYLARYRAGLDVPRAAASMLV